MLLALQFSGKIGIGTLITIAASLVALSVYLTNQFRGGDPADLREAYTVELERRREAEEREKKMAIELAAQKLKTDLSGLEERLVKRMDAFEKAQEKHTLALNGLVDAVAAVAKLVQKAAV